MTWKPHATVASIIERDGRFLMVKEDSEGHIVSNQPAGHLEPNESLINAAIRETKEETAWDFEPRSVVGIYRWVHPDGERTYLRVAFAGECTNHDLNQPLDEGIIEAVWLSREELVSLGDQLRSPLVLSCIDDYLAGKRYSLDLFSDI